MPGYWNRPATGQQEKQEPRSWSGDYGQQEDRSQDQGGGGGGDEQRRQASQQANLDRIKREAEARNAQEIINRNNAARIAKMEADKRAAEVASAGKVWDPKADDWAKDYSYSTKDVRSTPEEREKFALVDPNDPSKGYRSDVQTNAERLARLAYKLTNDPKYLNQAIFIPKGMTGAKDDPMFLDLWEKGQEALKTGDVETFFGALGKTQDITAGNPNIDYDTSYDPWYQGPTTTGGGGYGGWGSWGGYGGGYGGGGGGGYYGPQPGYKPEQMAGFYTPQANLQQAMVNVHQTPTVFKKRGGIVSLLRL
jgi:hypothetical protein